MTALAKAPGGTVKEGELEKEKGKLIWSFDIATPDTRDITEVNVDAITGQVVSVEKRKGGKRLICVSQPFSPFHENDPAFDRPVCFFWIMPAFSIVAPAFAICSSADTAFADESARPF